MGKKKVYLHNKHGHYCGNYDADKKHILRSHETETAPQISVNPEQLPSTWLVWDGNKWNLDKDKWITEAIRPERNLLLYQTDKFMMADYPLLSGQLDEIRAYRKALRDITKTITPEKPEFPDVPKWLGD